MWLIAYTRASATLGTTTGAGVATICGGATGAAGSAGSALGEARRKRAMVEARSVFVSSISRAAVCGGRVCAGVNATSVRTVTTADNATVAKVRGIVSLSRTPTGRDAPGRRSVISVARSRSGPASPFLQRARAAYLTRGDATHNGKI